jgi:type IV fimbrial biogenesis protein FimT
MKRLARGFNMMELLVTLIVVGVVITMGAPAMADFINDMRLSATTNDVLSFFNYARSEAAKRGTRVTVCVSADQAACFPGQTNWAVGALVFVDTNGNATVDAGETVLQVLNPMQTGVSVIATTPFATNHFFYYRPSGAASSQGTLRICKTGRLARDVSVNSVGRPISSTTTTVCT